MQACEAIKSLIEFGPRTGEQNILDARYFVVNRLAHKCIQGLGLNGIDPIQDANSSTNLLPAATVFDRSAFEIRAQRRKV